MRIAQVARERVGALGRDPHLRVVAAVIVAAGLVRFATLDAQSFDHDESVTATRVLETSFRGMLAEVASGERSGPLYYILAWPWSQVFGTGEVGLRSLSAIFGTLAVPVAYMAAAELVSRRAGVIAAVLVAVNPYLFWFSQEARSYGLFVLLVAVALLFMARSLREPTRRNVALWALASAAALATHYFALFLLLPQAALLLYRSRGRRTWAGVAFTGAAGLAILPLALYQNSQHPPTESGFAEDTLGGRLSATLVSVGLGEEGLESTTLLGVDGAGLAMAILVGALIAAGLLLLVLRAGPAERRGGLIAAGIAACGLLLPLLLVLGGLDVIDERNLVGVLVPLLVAAAAGFGAATAGRLGVAVAAVTGTVFLAGLVSSLTVPSLQRDNHRAVAEAIGPPAGDRLVLAPTNADDPLVAYLEGSVRKLASGEEGAEGADPVAQEIVVVTRREVSGPPVPGFALTEHRDTGEFEVYRYRADRPARVDPAQLDHRRLVGRRFTLLLQTAAGDAGSSA